MFVTVRNLSLAAFLLAGFLASASHFALAQATHEQPAPKGQAESEESLDICMEGRERLDLALATIGRELSVYLKQCLKKADQLDDGGREALNSVLNVPAKRKALLNAAGSVAVKAFTRAMPVAGEQLYQDFLEVYTRTIRRSFIGENKSGPKECGAYFTHMANALDGPEQALMMVVIDRAHRFQSMFPNCAK
jgi:hypothetical protein